MYSKLKTFLILVPGLLLAVYLLSQHQLPKVLFTMTKVASKGIDFTKYSVTRFCQTPLWNGPSYQEPHYLATPPESKYSSCQFLIYVYSGLLNINRRMELRWNMKKLFLNRTDEIIFIVGAPTEEHKKNITGLKLEKEMAEYKDMLQIGVADTYFNLGYKGLFVVDWIMKISSNLRLLAKIDDEKKETLESVQNMRNKLRKRDQDMSNTMACGLKAVGHRVHGKMAVKHWEVEDEEYRPATFPPYCIGDSGTFFSPQVAARLLYAAKYLKVFKIDDTYFSGMLRERACVESIPA